MFETGSDQWHEYAQWPPKQAHPAKLYLHAAGKLNFNPPPDAEGTDGSVRQNAGL